jgi:dTDP-4-amino-4,6-dideoxygalactose transaminase
MNGDFLPNNNILLPFEINLSSIRPLLFRFHSLSVEKEFNYDQKFGGVMEMFRNLPEYMIPYKRNPYTQEMKDAAVKILDQGASMVGRMREEIFFEKEVADFCGKRFGISCIHNAMHLLVDAAGIGPGDEVIIPPNTFTGMSQAIEYRGGRCVFVDVEEETFNLDPGLIEAKITDRTKIIFPAPLAGASRRYGSNHRSC